ncbi:ABC transporter permease [Massilia sp. Root351]|jgi:HlyD family secretion protein|uniref:efflux RND transporter periplasmic adaptor subunit n=1 Tax=Massilia sp. Root351 TaxID=1736522 RepID=UPI0007095FAD|nr:HlyD family efflux transporter periplasmic adaptor subunit [Massilia sp. Root351]KQV85887.1 ABC transporter permease [Massilia sp. Root351]
MDTALDPRIINRRRRRTLAAGIGALVLVCAAAWGINRAASPGVSRNDISVAEIRRGSIASTVSASGIVVPEHEELVPSPIQSRVAKVHAKLGQQVAAHELLLELDDRSVRLAIDAIQEQIAQQDNRILGLTLEMDQKRKQYASAIELLELDLQSTRAKRERYATLRKVGAVSGEDMLTAELNVQRIEVQLRQQKELIEDNRRSTASGIEGARLQKSILQKQLDQQQILLAQTRVRAPFAGMLTSLAAEEGAAVAVGQLVAKVSDLANYRVEATLSDFHTRLLSPGQAVRVEQGKQLLAGRVHTILPEIQNGSVKLLVALEQPSHPLLRNKLRVDVNIVIEQKANVLVADSGPAFNGKGRQAVFVLRGGVARKTMLDIGAGDGKAVEIAGGAQLGERVIISDTSRYQEHDSIRVE